jgi:hypothetical protein
MDLAARASQTNNRAERVAFCSGGRCQPTGDQSMIVSLRDARNARSERTAPAG